jgi:16S rRNA U516 pseudouridylate synthase RsuA-like enzyme
VLKLVRIRIGSFALGALPVGDFAVLSPADLRKLLNPNPSSTTC